MLYNAYLKADMCRYRYSITQKKFTLVKFFNRLSTYRCNIKYAIQYFTELYSYYINALL